MDEQEAGFRLHAEQTWPGQEALLATRLAVELELVEFENTERTATFVWELLLCNHERPLLMRLIGLESGSQLSRELRG